MLINDEWCAHIEGLFGEATRETYWASDNEQARDDAVGVEQIIALGDSVLIPQIGVRLRRLTDQTISDDTMTRVGGYSEVWDIGGLWPGGSSTRISITELGAWAVGGSMLWADSADGKRQHRIKIGGGAEILRTNEPALGTQQGISISTVWNFEATGTIQLDVKQTSGGDLKLLTAAEFSVDFWAYYLGPLP